MAKHTRGPWQAEFNEFGGYDYLTAAWDVRSSTRTVTSVDCGECGYANNEVAEANARLIAAAPTMLEALKGLTLLISNLREVYSSDAADFIMNKPTYKAAVEAIKQAEGE